MTGSSESCDRPVAICPLGTAPRHEAIVGSLKGGVTFSWEYLIRTYGYAGIIVCTCLGAEEGILIGGFLASGGYLSLGGVIAAAALGGSIGDQAFFYLARRQGERLLGRSKRMKQSYGRVQQLVQEYGLALVLASRFLVGFRITVSAVCGVLGMTPLTYSLLNLISAFLWASLYGLLTYYFGRTLVGLPGLSRMVFWTVAALLVGFVFLSHLWWRNRM